jgi:antibiotic biosynthesis monooxygenase (ABM) superfamily enzyme
MTITGSRAAQGSSRLAPVKAVFERRVSAGAESAFRAWSERFIEAASGFPGHEGASVLSVDHGESRYLLLRFASATDLAHWERSAEYAALMRDADAFGPAGDYAEIRTGLETWFTLPDRAAPARRPPRWKVALTTWVGLFPIVVLLTALLRPLELPALAGQIVATAIPVVLLTWVVMPALTRQLYGWLYPGLK